ncbi:cytochrome P450 [Mycena capillaripes]|nr:cytochrome P450 [Mycena capillaripes]
MFVPSSLQIVQTLFLLVALLYARNVFRRGRPPLPPGPRGLPFLGNIFALPKHSPWLAFAEMGQKWGDIVSVTTFGKTMIILNSVKVAEDLLESKGSNFSDRPVIQMGGELVGFRNVLTFCQYGDRVRKERKLFHQLFGTSKAIERFIPLLRSENHKLLQILLLSPRDVMDGIQRTTGAIVLRIAYGYRIAEGKDQFLEMFDLRADIFTRSTQPTAFLVNYLPALRYWPAWLPGGHFHTLAKKWAKIIQDSVDTPHEYVKQQMWPLELRKILSRPPYCKSNLMKTISLNGPHPQFSRVEAVRYEKQSGTTGDISALQQTSSQLEAFFLAMILYPAVQAEAQRELDRVVGNDRLPDISDRQDLPYMNALCKEILRWHNAAPMGIPHRVRQDFIYEREGGQPPLLIPKDSLIIPNIWNMTHDPREYRDPMVFNPGRFTATNTKNAEQDPSRICFGYGRRMCPGKLLADTSLFMTCSMVLAVFNIKKVYKNGVTVEPLLGQTTGTVSQPFPFECTVEPRNTAALSLIHGTYH